MNSSSIQLRWGLRIPLRDGITLHATLYLPKEQPAPAPCILSLTPYISDTYHERGVYFATHGFPFAIVNVRGRGNSQGKFRPNIQEARDGYDVVEWLALQPYCNGKVSMWGGSYAGYSQWASAKEFPPHLATIVPVAAPYMGLDFPIRNNISSPFAVQWLTFTSGHASQVAIFNDNSFWNERYREHFESGAPLNTFDSVVSNQSAVFQEWLAHPHPDEYWDRYNPTSEQYAKLNIPVLTITGSYDDDQSGALMHYREHLQNASAAARDRHYLVIGPWDHAGTRTPKAQFGGLECGPESLVDLGELHVAWYRWTMQAGPRPEFLRNRVAYYVMGAEAWNYAKTLDAVTIRKDAYYLHSEGNPTNIFNSGFIIPTAPSQSEPGHYIYNPADVDSASLQSAADPTNLVDQSLAQTLTGKHFVFHSEPFKDETEISGFFELSAWISIDQPDTDFEASIHEIQVGGRSILLTTDRMRARYRESFRKPVLVNTQAPLRYDFRHFTFISRRMSKASRLRLIIGPINSIFIEKNFNAGGTVACESVRDARPVNVFLYHDPEHPSVLSVPIGNTDV